MRQPTQRNPDAASHQTTRLARASALAHARHDERREEERRLEQRRRIAGTAKVGVDFPPDVMRELGDISESERDAALAFTLTYWWLFRRPAASCQGLYERMLAGGFGDDYAERIGESDDAELRRIIGHKRRWARWIRALGGKFSSEALVLRLRDREVRTGAALVYPPQGRSPYGALMAIGPYLGMPRYVKKMADGEVPNSDDLAELHRFKRAVELLTNDRAAEDRYVGKANRDDEAGA